MEKQTRHRFAQMTVGMDIQSSFGGKTVFLDQQNRLQEQSLGSLTRPRIIIGGTHFWGHADIYVAFPLAYPSFETTDLSARFGSTVETIFKYYPWKIEENKIRPFIGTGIVPYQYNQDSKTNDLLSNGDWQNWTSAPLLTGLTFNKGNHLFEASLTYNYAFNQDYYISPTQIATIEIPRMNIAFSYKFLFDTTISAEEGWENGNIQKATKILKERGDLDGFFVGVAPSSSFGVRSSSYNNTNHPYFGSFSSSIFIDLAAGYHFAKPNMNLHVSWRKFNNNQSSFNVAQTASRNSLSLELTKNLFDFHGFVPFIGLCFSYERLGFAEAVDGNLTIDESENKPALGIVFGWDILPSRLDDFVLRTNLRYFPNLNLELSEGESIAFDNIEFNFIQLIVYPERIFKKW